MGIENADTANKRSKRYVHAAGWQALTRLYDPVLAMTMREQRFRGAMKGRAGADLPSQGTAVDVGCGTGTFAIALAAERPDVHAIGVDGDAAILGLARQKRGAGPVEWRQGLAQDLPLADGVADVLTMSLLLHHLLTAEKRDALTEARRVLKPGGWLHIADWGRPHDPLMSGAFFVAQAVDGFDRTRDHRAGRVPELIAEAGFGSVERYERLRTAFGSLDIWAATSAEEAG